MKLIVGLGNIGREYANTKHNIGFMVADELAKRWKVSFDKNDRHAMYAEYRTPERVALIKPTTYMNLSGVAVGEWANFYHIDVEDIAIFLTIWISLWALSVFAKKVVPVVTTA